MLLFNSLLWIIDINKIHLTTEIENGVNINPYPLLRLEIYDIENNVYDFNKL